MQGTIVILTDSPFSKRDHDRFGVPILRRYFAIAILDCSAWRSPETWKKDSEEVFRCDGYKSIADFAGFVESMREPGRCLAIDYLNDFFRGQKIRRYLKARNVPRVIVCAGLLPLQNSGRLERFRRMFAQTALHELPGKIYGRAMRFFLPAPEPEIVLLSGEAALRDKGLDRIPHKIWAHSFDYDVFMETNGSPCAEAGPYAVFLDEDMAGHPDYERLKIKPYATKENYFPSMNDFFGALEEKTQMPVVIALHPRASGSKATVLWGGRKAVSHQTAQLVRGAALVLCHQSTSISFAVLWRKPVAVLTTQELGQSPVGPGLALMSAVLDAPLINVDALLPRRLEDKSLYKVNDAAYTAYIENYIKRSGTPDLPAWQIFSEYVVSDYWAGSV